MTAPTASPTSMTIQPPPVKQPQPQKWGEMDAAMTLSNMGKNISPSLAKN
jgi:hypothetical protein